MEIDKYNSKCVFLGYCPMTLCRTPKDISLFVTIVYWELLVVDKCNCINVWSENDIMESLFFLGSNT